MATKAKAHSARATSFTAPMLAESIADLSLLDESVAWNYEPKIDGHRTQLAKVGDRITILTRNGVRPAIDVSRIEIQARALGSEALKLDGEIAAVDEKGIPNWEGLQRRDPRFPLAFFAFDILELEGRSLLSLPLKRRKQILARVIDGTQLKFCHAERGTPATIIRRLRRQGHEGIVAKDPESVYLPGRRSHSWRKYPFVRKQEFVIGGYKPIGKDSLDSLLVGVYEKDKLVLAAQLRSGLDRTNKGQLRKALALLNISTCPFANVPTSKRRTKSGWHSGGVSADELPQIQFTRPHLLAVVEFRGWLSSGLLRHGRYAGWRLDKPASQVVRET